MCGPPTQSKKEVDMKINRDRLLRLTSRLNENRITDTEREELSKLLHGSEDARQWYCEMQHQESFFQQSNANAWQTDANKPISVPFQKWWGPLLATAALVLITTLIAGSFLGLPDSLFRKQGSAIATMRSGAGSSIKQMYPGKYKIKAGAHTLDFFAGAQIKLLGPATIRIQDEMTLEVINASIAAHVTPSAKGFKIISGDATFVDLGTEFAVQATEEETSLRVFKGQVLANTTNTDGSTERTLLVEPEQPLRYDPQFNRYRKLNNDAAHFHEYQQEATSPLSMIELYQSEVMSAQPSFYWNFDDLAGETFTDQISNRTLRTMGGHILNPTSGSNGAVQFMQDDQFHMLRLDGQMEFRENQSFTIEFLFCADRVGRSTLLALYDENSVKPGGGADHFVLVETMTRPEIFTHVPGAIRSTYRPTPSANVMDGVNSFSREQYMPGKWVHFAMTFDGKTLRTFFDSELQNIVDLSEDENLGNGQFALVLGQTSSSDTEEIPVDTYRPFVGSIDELAFYDRALTPREIETHKRSLDR